MMIYDDDDGMGWDGMVLVWYGLVWFGMGVCKYVPGWWKKDYLKCGGGGWLMRVRTLDADANAD